ncbi:ABC transporter ATP-binding protein [Emcibacter nanhaiensis]|uniref:ABC transporter ATP-binding protein n=1 Tax=Emcibacter nanhaiensis TaxID=1505037 RepID=A0A501PT64_9PROT|nr:ABC transporter ATP-binding protein [Emcibacter nanhaiensis]TPD62901.1 ABC transporter ATP-binding protein [Emcibacter nanhaiensis]
MSNPILQLQNIHRHFFQGGEDLHILKGVNLEIQAGETVSLVGASGAGKSTLLHITGLLEKANEGDVMIDGVSCNGLSDIKRTRIRRNEIGFVYQFHHLLPEFTALENVVMPQMIAGVGGNKARKRAEELLEKMGLAERLTHRPAQLSGGEQQRVAIARALANRPKLLLADEPTGNLDETTGGEVLNILLDLAREEGTAALLATHNTSFAKRTASCVILKDGKLHKGVKMGA